jgi:hypothetical protein
MKRFLICLGLIATCSLGARATDLEGTVGIGLPPGGFPFTALIALSNINIAENPDLNLGFVLSTQRLETSINAGFEFGPLGRATIDTRFNLLYGGVRFKTDLKGTLGPIALGLEGGFWTIASNAMSNWAPFERTIESNSASGFLLGISAQYRISRNLTVKAAGRYVPESSRINLGVDYRAGDLTLSGGFLLAPQASGDIFYVPPAPGLSYGVTFGLKYVPEDVPFRINIDGMLASGPNGFTYGFGLDLGYDFLNQDDEKTSTLSAYFVYEPWRQDIVHPLRFGTSYEFNLGSGVFVTRAFGGLGFYGQFGYGFSLGYRISWDNLFGVQP